MSSQSKLDPNLRETAASSWQPFLRQKFVKLLPPIWYNNDLDTHHISRDRIWFLQENRFLFFTRNGPVEITLKPTTVLASAIICMVGVSVIFLSTIFASYNAIEVIRDESIQPAKASMAATGSQCTTRWRLWRWAAPKADERSCGKPVILHRVLLCLIQMA